MSSKSMADLPRRPAARRTGVSFSRTKTPVFQAPDYLCALPATIWTPVPSPLSPWIIGCLLPIYSRHLSCEFFGSDQQKKVPQSAPVNFSRIGPPASIAGTSMSSRSMADLPRRAAALQAGISSSRASTPVFQAPG